MFEVGLAKEDFRFDCPGVGMLGYADYEQTVSGVRAPLSARAFFVKNRTGARLMIVVCELAWITQAVRHRVIETLEREHPELELGEHNVLLTATHTHSGPGGYSHHLIYNITVPGFVPEVFDAIVAAIVAAIVRACQTAQPGKLSVARGNIPLTEPVAFNRSVAAYNTNPDVIAVDPSSPERATNRTMTVMRFDAANGEALGALCWFGVHATSLHSDNRHIDGDNKGHAARQFERAMQPSNPGFVAAFAQTCPADVSPNFRWDAGKGVMAGAASDDVSNAKWNGGIQYRFARKLYVRARKNPLTSDRIWSRVHYENHGRIDVAKRYAPGVSGAKTHAPRFGMSMAMGTWDGRGPLFALPGVVGLLNRTAPWGLGPGAKYPLVDLSGAADSKLLALFSAENPRVPGWIYPAIDLLKVRAKRGIRQRAPWVPEVLPIQLVVLGSVAVAALPGEPSTVAGRRLEHGLLRKLRDSGVEQVVVAGYANAYSSYIVTSHEYDAQAYEGGSTLFGPWTLAAYQTRFDTLAARMVAMPQATDVGIGETPYVANHDVLEWYPNRRPNMSAIAEARLLGARFSTSRRRVSRSETLQSAV